MDFTTLAVISAAAVLGPLLALPRRAGRGGGRRVPGGVRWVARGGGRAARGGRGGRGRGRPLGAGPPPRGVGRGRGGRRGPRIPRDAQWGGAAGGAKKRDRRQPKN